MDRLSNHRISIAVDRHGAELQSIVKNGREYLWQGDSRFWGRRSPVLFPIVGRVWDNVYRHDGREYQLGQHGFARDMEFTPVAVSDTRLEYELVSSDATRALYPFDFSLRIAYTLEGDSVRVEWRVANTGVVELPFQIGAHPAFYLPDFDPANDPRGYFRFDNPGPLRYISPVEKGCVSTEEHQLVTEEGALMAIRRDTFDCDTYIFEDSQLHRVELLSAECVPYLSVEFTAPLVALWAPTATKPDCPFVCIEPWYGRCDAVGYSGDFALRDVMQHLAPGAEFEASYTVTLV